MNIAEIVGSLLNQKDDAAAAPNSSLMHRIANAFTRNGQVKHDWDVERLPQGPATPLAQLPSAPPMPEEELIIPGENAVQNAGTTVPTVSDPRTEFQSPLSARHVNPFTPQARSPELGCEGRMRQNVSNGADHRSR